VERGFSGRTAAFRGRSSRPPDRRVRFGLGPEGRTRALTRASPRIRPKRPALGSSITSTSASSRCTPRCAKPDRWPRRLIFRWFLPSPWVTVPFVSASLWSVSLPAALVEASAGISPGASTAAWLEAGLRLGRCRLFFNCWNFFRLPGFCAPLTLVRVGHAGAKHQVLSNYTDNC